MIRQVRMGVTRPAPGGKLIRVGCGAHVTKLVASRALFYKRKYTVRLGKANFFDLLVVQKRLKKTRIMGLSYSRAHAKNELLIRRLTHSNRQNKTKIPVKANRAFWSSILTVHVASDCISLRANELAHAINTTCPYCVG